MLAIGIAEWCLDTRGIAALERARDLGILNLHYGLGSWNDVELISGRTWLRAITESCNRTGVDISGLALNFIEKSGIFPRGGRNEAHKCRESFLIALDNAVELKIPLIYFPSFGASEIKTKSDWEETVELLRFACERASGTSIEIASENSLSSEANLLMALEINHGNFRLLYDTYNPVRFGHSPARIAKLNFGSIAAQIHVKDGLNGKYGSVPLGAGDGDISGVLGTLIELGYDGLYVLENNYTHDTEYRVLRDISTLCRIVSASSA